MKAHALLKLHQRQQSIIEMIIDCDGRITMKKSDLKRITSNTNQENKWWNAFTKAESHCEDRINRYTAIKQRLISYYKDIQIRIMTLQPEIELPERECDLLTNQFLS